MLNVWYLDDEIYLCEIFNEEFSSENIRIQTFTESNMVFDAIKTQTPDLFFIDYRLQKTNGDKVAQDLNINIPMILITGDLIVQTTYNFLQVISKPYKHNEILDILTNFLETSHK